ncbi:major capsid protein [Lysinibacillus sp. YS11]|nr:major capsid protein [Lysinibacillus sp. YS11]
MQAYRGDALIRPQDLNAIDKRVYEPHASELKARSIFSLKTDIPAGAKTYSYDVLTRSGAAKILAPGATDVPLVDADLTEETVKIYSIAAAFNISIFEVREAEMAGRPIDVTKADTVRKAIAEKENQVAFSGDKKHGIKGLTDSVGIQVYATPQNNGGTSTKWADKTGEEIIDDIIEAKSKVDMLNGHEADTLLLTPEAKKQLQKKVYNEFTKQTALQYLQSENMFKRIETINDLKGKGLANTDCFVVLDSSPDVAELGIPLDITRHPQEYAFPNTKVPFEERTTGLIIRYPMAICRADGI